MHDILSPSGVSSMGLYHYKITGVEWAERKETEIDINWSRTESHSARSSETEMLS